VSAQPTEEDVRQALAVLEEVLSLPSVSDRDTRTKRRIRVEMRRLLSAEETGG